MTGQRPELYAPVTRRGVSLRLRLTLWNVGVVVLILFALGVVLRYALQASLIASMDRDLVHGMRGFAAAYARKDHLPQPPADAPGPPAGELRPLLLDPAGHSLDSKSRRALPYDLSGMRAAFASGQAVYATVDVREQYYRVISYPMRRADGTIGAVAQFPMAQEEIDSEVNRLTRLLLALAGPGVLLAAGGGAFLSSRALRPIRRITHAAARIEAEDLSGRLSVSGHDEISELAATFNGMLARLEESFRQREDAYRQMERALEQQQRFTADASHELKSPLTVIEGTVTLSLSAADRTAAQYRAAMETIGGSARRMNHIVRDLLLLAQSDAGQLDRDRRTVDLHDVLALARDAVDNPGDGPGAAAILLPERESPVYISVDPAHLVRLFINLFDNALRHTPPEGRIVVSLAADAAVTVTVADTGAGIPPEAVPHLFNRFYRVDSARARSHGGTGLGLAICRSIAEAYGGAVEIESTVAVGTNVFVKLPLASGFPSQPPLF